jgi:hypothetical protein
MAFDKEYFARSSVALNTGMVIASGSEPASPTMFTYRSATDAVATIAGANYFADAVWMLSLNDLIYVSGSDAVGMYVVDAIDRPAGTITVAAASLTGVVNTANIAANAVTLAKLASGITPSHVVKYAGQPTTVGGAAAEAFTVTGVAATDLAFVQIVDNGTANVTALQAVCTLNTLTVTFSGNPGADCVFNYQILRAAS